MSFGRSWSSQCLVLLYCFLVLRKPRRFQIPPSMMAPTERRSLGPLRGKELVVPFQRSLVLK
jgi:hypothetical protein